MSKQFNIMNSKRLILPTIAFCFIIDTTIRIITNYFDQYYLVIFCLLVYIPNLFVPQSVATIYVGTDNVTVRKINNAILFGFNYPVLAQLILSYGYIGVISNATNENIIRGAASSLGIIIVLLIFFNIINAFITTYAFINFFKKQFIYLQINVLIMIPLYAFLLLMLWESI